MSPDPFGISTRRWGSYAVAGTLILFDFLWLARGLKIEYPVLIGFILWLPSWLPGGPASWFATAGLLTTATTVVDGSSVPANA